MFAISKSPRGCASAALQPAQLGEREVGEQDVTFMNRQWWRVGEMTQTSRGGEAGPLEGQVAGIACTSADVPRCHSTCAAE